MQLIVQIGVVVLATLLLIIYFKDSYLEHKVLVPRLVYAGTIVLVGLLYILVFYDLIKDDTSKIKIVNYISYGLYIVLALSYFFIGLRGIYRNHLYRKYLEIVENDREFILLDSHNRIKAMSNDILSSFKEVNKRVYGKNFFLFFDELYNVDAINSIQASNNDLHKAFFDLNKEIKSRVFKREIALKDSQKNEYTLVCNDYIICENDKFIGHILVSEKHTNDTVLNVEEELQSASKDLDDIKIKFQATLEMTEEAMMFYSLNDQMLWVNDNMVNLLHLKGNTLSFSDFSSLIYQDDLDYYKGVLDNLTKQNPTYETSYRIRIGASYVYVKEHGKRLFDASEDQIMSYLYVIHANHYERSNIPELDNIKSNAELLAKLEELYKQGRTFQLVTFKMNNLPEINEGKGRDMGNMVLAEYVKAINKSFVDDNLIYRTSGLEFSFIILDYRKMDLLSQALKKNQILNASMKYGSNTIQTDVYMGIATSNDVQGKNHLIEAAKKSLKAATMPQMRTNYIYYTDIK